MGYLRRCHQRNDGVSRTLSKVGWCKILKSLFKSLPLPLRYDKARVLFNTIIEDAFVCFENCLSYNRAQAPIFADKEEMTELMTWVVNTTTDPVTAQFYKDVVSPTFWLPLRFII